MALSLIGRYNLNLIHTEAPYRPAMGAMDIMIYRRTLTEVRKVIWGVSDVVLANLASITAGDVISVGGVSQVINNHYVTGPAVSGNLSPIFHAVDIDTGIETSNSIAAGNIGLDKISRSNTRTVSCETFGGVAGIRFTDFDVPITSIATRTAGGLSGDGAYRLATIEPILLGGDFYNILETSDVIADPGVWYHGLNVYKESAAGIFSCWHEQRGLYVYLNHGIGGPSFSYTASSTPKPGVWQRDGEGYIYALVEVSGAIYWVRWTETDLPNALYLHQTETSIPGASYGAVTSTFNRASNGSFHINKQFKKAYFAISTSVTNVQRLAHQKLPVTAGYEYTDVDTAKAVITGIWTFPPFVFVAKTGGATYGPQLIKYFDPDLVLQTKSRRSGSEIWELIPEVGQYLL